MRLVFVVLSFLVSGALAGVLGASYFGPGYIATRWANNTSCLCAENGRQSAEMLIDFQMKGLLIGALGGLVAGIAFVVWRKRAKKAPAATTPPAT